ncbi:MAG TPA: sensor histidine kinase [Ktedonosporobacter sp.]|nr:sensor histidine kinase [Ktedonosporobacter sp.]
MSKPEKIIRQDAKRTPGASPAPWKGLQARMTLSYTGVTLGMALLFEGSHMLLSAFTPSLRLSESQGMRIDLVGSLIVALIGACFGIVATRGLIGRLRRIASATTLFAAGQYDQRLPATAADEIGQLEAHFNQMAEQLSAHMGREKLLTEQNARLEERTRLSRDLHDSVKQHIFALTVQVELARSLLDPDQAAVRAHLGFADELSYQVQQELTVLIRALRPVDLQAKGLATALRDYVTTWSRQSGIVVDVQLPVTCHLPAPVEETLWRLMQEALSNIARHSQATRVRLHLAEKEQQVTLSLSDDGRGFDPQAVEQEGIGLRSMRERIEQVGGSVRIKSEKGQGTHLVAHCPLSESLAIPQEHEVMP